MNTKYRDKILNEIKTYLKKLDKEDFSHNSDHIFRVENIAKKIAKEENADIEIIEASCLLFDIARWLEDRGAIEDHSQKGVEIARKVLNKIDFPKDKINDVCHAIYVHRRSKKRTPKTLEAKILRDSDYLDAMGAIDIARVIASSIQSKKYKKPIYIENNKKLDDPNSSAIHFLFYKLNHPKHQPSNFYTKLGKKLAKDRYAFMKEYSERFINEWKGEK